MKQVGGIPPPVAEG